MNWGNHYWLYAIIVVVCLWTLIFIYLEKYQKNILLGFSYGVHQDFKLNRKWIGLKFGCMLAGFILLCLALARPQIGFAERALPMRGIDIVVAIDVSRSMLAEDIKPNRLERAKLAVAEWLHRLKQDRVAILAFAGSAFLECPLTTDYHSCLKALEAIDTEIIPIQGTSFGIAMQEALRAFSNIREKNVMILISDGEDLYDHHYLNSIDQRLITYTVGVGTKQGDVIPIRQGKDIIDYIRDKDGKIVKTTLNDDLLNQIATKTQGRYFPLGVLGEGLNQVYNDIRNRFPAYYYEDYLEKTPRDYFQVCIILAIIMVILESICEREWSKKIK